MGCIDKNILSKIAVGRCLVLPLVSLEHVLFGEVWY